MEASPIDVGPGWTWRSVIFACGVTACLFGVLPLLERWDAPEQPDLTVREVRPVTLPPPPETLPDLTPPEEMLIEPEVEWAQPETAPSVTEVQPESIPVDLSVGIGDVAGNFSTRFSLTDQDLTAGMAQALFDVSELDQGLRPIVQLRPQYPPRSRMRRIEGHVTVEYIVGENGTVGEVQILESVPEGEFDRSVERSVSRWRFEPGRKNGRAVSTRVRQRIDFTLD